MQRARLLGGLVVGTFLAFAPTLCAAGIDAGARIDYPVLMQSTVEGLIASQLPDGLFPYGYDFLADEPLEPGRLSPENLVRQAGMASALAAYYQRTHDPRLREPILHLLSAFGRHSLPIGKSRVQHWIESAHLLSIPYGRWRLQTTLLRHGLLYEPEGAGRVISSNGKYDVAATGTVALALLAELRYANASGDNRFAALRASWVEALLELRIPSGGFRWLPTSIDDSAYYNGEGWLALAVYGELHAQDASVASALDDLDHAMIARYAHKPDPEFFSWGAMAAAQRYATTQDARFAAYLRGQAALFISRFRARHGSADNNCAAMEGVAASLGVLQTVGRAREGADADLVLELERWLAPEAAKLPRLQVRPGQEGMELGGAARLSAPRMASYGGVFLNGLYQPSTRVDLTQHCLSAMLLLDRLGHQASPR